MQTNMPLSAVQVGNLHIDRVRFEVKVRERDIRVSRKEFGLLWVLAAAEGRAFRREELIEHVWGSGLFVDARTVDVHVARLRTKLKDVSGGAPAIGTVWGSAIGSGCRLAFNVDADPLLHTPLIATRQNLCLLACSDTGVWIHQASPVCMGGHAPITGGHQLVPNITAILPCFTSEWAALLQPDAILAAWGEIGYTGWRARVLTPVTTVHLFLLQIFAWQHSLQPSAPSVGLTVHGGGLLASPGQTPDPLLCPPLGALQPCRAAIGRGRRAVAWASHLPRRWLGLLDA